MEMPKLNLPAIKLEKKHVAAAAVITIVLAVVYFEKEVKPTLTEPQQHAVEGMFVGAALLAGLLDAGIEFKKNFAEIGVAE